MKRLLSWVVLIVCMTVFYYVQKFMWEIVFRIISWLNSLPTVWFWVVLLFGGSAFIGAIIGIFAFCITKSVGVSQLISPSKNGTRYIVIGIIYSIWYLLAVIFSQLGILVPNNKTFFIICVISMIIFSIGIIIVGVLESKENQE